MLIKNFKSLLFIIVTLTTVSVNATAGRYSPMWYSTEAEPGYPLGKHIIRNCEGTEVAGSLYQYAKYSIDFTEINIMPGNPISFCYTLLETEAKLCDAIKRAKPRIEFLDDKIKDKQATNQNRTEYMNLTTSLEMWLNDLRILRASPEFQEEIQQLITTQESKKRQVLLLEEDSATEKLDQLAEEMRIPNAFNPKFREEIEKINKAMERAFQDMPEYRQQ